MTAHERTAWRDQKLSARHRAWGFNCPAVDLDAIYYGADAMLDDSFRVVEFDALDPKLLVDYKLRLVDELTDQPELDAGIRTQINLARRADLPFAVVTYDSDEWLFCVHPMHKFQKPWAYVMSEREFVEFLYLVRGRPVPSWLFV